MAHAKVPLFVTRLNDTEVGDEALRDTVWNYFEPNRVCTEDRTVATLEVEVLIEFGLNAGDEGRQRFRLRGCHGFLYLFERRYCGNQCKS
jgi:hypothetical protein